MPNQTIVLPDGSSFKVQSDKPLTEEEVDEIASSYRRDKSQQMVEGMSGEELFKLAEENPTADIPNDGLRKIYDHLESKSMDWWKVAKSVPGGIVQGGAGIIQGAWEMGTKEVPGLLGEGSVNPASAAGKAANTMGEAGLRMSRELEMLPPVNWAYRKILDSKIPSFKDWSEKHLKTLKGQMPYEIEMVERLAPEYYKKLKSDYAAFEDEKRFTNFKETWFKRQADRAKAAAVEAGDTSYLSEESGGKENLKRAMGSGEVMNKTAQFITDTTGPDVTSVIPIGKVLGRGKINAGQSKVGKAASKGADWAMDKVDRLGAAAQAGGRSLRKSAWLPQKVTGYVMDSAGSKLRTTSALVGAVGDMRRNMSISAAARRTRIDAAKKILSSLDREWIETALHRFANGIDEGIAAGVRGGAVGAAMMAGSLSEEELGGGIGAQIGYTGVVGGTVGASSRAISDLKVANRLLRNMDPDARAELMFTRMAIQAADGKPMAQQNMVAELADVMRAQENLVHDGDTIMLLTPQEIGQHYADKADAGTVERMMTTQGFVFNNPATGGKEIVVNTAVSKNMAETAMHEIMHSLRGSDAELPTTTFDEMRAAYNDDAVEPRMLKAELEGLFNDTFGAYDEQGREVSPGILSKQETENMIRAYLGRLHDDADAINEALKIDGREMSHQEMVDAYGDELFSSIAETLSPSTLRTTKPAAAVNGIRAHLHKLRQLLGRKGVNPESSDALDVTSQNPVLRRMVGDYLRTRKKLTSALNRDSSPLMRNVSIKRVAEGRRNESNEKRKQRVNDLAGTGVFKLNEKGEVLATSGAVFQGEKGQMPQVLSPAEQSKVRKVAMESIKKALEDLGDQDDGMSLVEPEDGVPYWRGVPNQAQLSALLNLPASTVPARLKENIRQFAEAISEGEGKLLGIDYNKALTGRKYDSRARMKYEHVAPFSMGITKAGNFIAQVLAITKLQEKMQAKLKSNPDWFSPWSDDQDPSGQAGFMRELTTALDRQRQGIENNSNNTRGYEKMIEILGVRKLDGEHKERGSLIQTRRMDRVNSIHDTGDRGFKIDYGRYKSPATFQGKISFQPGDSRIGPVYHGSPDFIGDRFDRKYLKRGSGLSRGGFSFTESQADAEAFMRQGIDPDQAAVDMANDAMRMAEKLMDAGVKIDGFTEPEELPEFNSLMVDADGGFRDYLKELADVMPPDVSDMLNRAASLGPKEANPRLIKAMLTNPRQVDVHGKKVWVADDPSQIEIIPDTRFQPLPAGDQVDPLVNLIRANPDGFTMNLAGDPADGGFVVAPSKATEWFVTEENLSPEAMEAYFEKHGDIFETDGVHLGGWYDTQKERYVLDAVIPMEQFDDAVKVALWASQDAIFDLNTFNEIRTKDENGQPISPEGFGQSVEEVFGAAPQSVLAYASQRRRKPQAVGQTPDAGSDPAGGTDVRFQPKPRKGRVLRTVHDETQLPLILRGALKGSLQKKVLDTSPEKLFERLNTATAKIQDDPSRFTNEKGFVEYFNDAGVHGNILHPPGGLDLMINRPSEYVDLVKGGYHEGKTAEGTIQAAMSGLDGVKEMRDVIGDKPSKWVTALHHLWGILSRRLQPLHQEALWLRMISNPEVLKQIQSSIDGRFNLSSDQWNLVVNQALKESAVGAEKMGNSGTSNANAFYLMLKRWNGKWGDVSDVYDKSLNSIESGRKFWSLGHGPVGIKNKVQRFIGLTFGTPAVIMDRWKFVEFWLPDAMGVKGASKPSEYFKYSRNTPEDPIGIYGAYGAAESSNPAYSLALYEALETSLQSAIDVNPELQELLGRHAHIGGAHWVGWNAIKNEAVGHSSLDITKELSKIKNLNDSVVYETVQNSAPYTEGLSGSSEIIRFTLDRGKPSVQRRSVSSR